MRVAVRTLKALLAAGLIAAGLLVPFGPAQSAFAVIPAPGDITDNPPKTTTPAKNTTPTPTSQNITCLNGAQVPDGTKGGTKAPSGTDCALKNGKCDDPSHCDLIQHYLNPAIDFTAALVGVAVVISIIIGGIQYSSAGGNAQAVSAAKARIRNALIALVVFALLYAMLDFLIPGGLV